jgi:hypothetical protein
MARPGRCGARTPGRLAFAIVLALAAGGARAEPPDAPPDPGAHLDTALEHMGALRGRLGALGGSFKALGEDARRLDRSVGTTRKRVELQGQELKAAVLDLAYKFDGVGEKLRASVGRFIGAR